MAPWGLYSTHSVTRLYPAASAASVALNFAVASRTFITSRSTLSLYPLGRMPGTWLVSVSPACAKGDTMRAIVINSNPVNPLNLVIFFSFVKLVLGFSLMRIVIPGQGHQQTFLTDCPER